MRMFVYAWSSLALNDAVSLLGCAVACGELPGPSVWPDRCLTFLFVSLCSWIPILGILSLTTTTSLCWFTHALSRLTGFFGASLSHCARLCFSSLLPAASTSTTMSSPSLVRRTVAFFFALYDVLALVGRRTVAFFLCPRHACVRARHRPPHRRRSATFLSVTFAAAVSFLSRAVLTQGSSLDFCSAVY